MKSPCCNKEFILRGRSKRKGELLLLCPDLRCRNPKWQCRDGKYSHPYQSKKKSTTETKSIPVRGRMKKSDYENIISKYGSFQVFLDSVIQ